MIQLITLNQSLIHTQLLNEFHLTPNMRSTLDSYYILHWTYEHLLRKTTFVGTIIHADVEYIPVYKCCTHLQDDTQLRLSFRKPKAEFEIKPYVLIKEVK